MSGLPLEETGASLNGHTPELLLDDVAADLPRIDPKRGVIITRSGVELELSGKLVSSLVLERIGNEGKPRIPLIEVNVLGKKTVEYHAQDEGYKAAMEEWQADVGLKTLRYLFTIGLKSPDIPQSFLDDHRPFLPNASDQDMKYLYIASLIGKDDIDFFSEALMGAAMPTQKGLEASADSFRNQG